MSLITDRGGASTQAVPLIGLAQAGTGGYFDDGGFPAGKGWDEIAFPAVNDEHVYALEVSGDSMQPAYRDGTVIVVSPTAPVRRGDRVVVKTRDGEVMAKELKRRTAKSIELRSLNPGQAERTLSVDDVRWIARIMWAKSVVDGLRRSRCPHRWEVRHPAHPGGELRAADCQIARTSAARLVHRHRQKQVRHRDRPVHHRVRHLRLENIGEALSTRSLVCEHGRRPLVLGTAHLAHVDRDAVGKAARGRFDAPIRQVGCSLRIMKPRLAIEAVEIGADDLAVLHPDAIVVDEVGHTA